MNEQEILNFRNSLSNLSIDELLDKRTELQEKISKMILATDCVVQIAIIEDMLNKKLQKESQDGKTINV